ncbi:hypothetical protein [Maricaulis sp. CAU 1757]
MRLPALCLSGLALALAASPSVLAQTAREAETRRYQACLLQVEDAPAAALEAAQTWQQTGGGWPPDVCAALAYVALGEAAVGAAVLDDLVAEPRPGLTEADRVSLQVEAGDAWRQAGNEEAALAAYERALELDADSLAARAARAQLHLDAGEVSALAIDANRLINLAPGAVDGWRLRSEYHLARDDFDAAQADLEQARQLAPDDIDLLVLRGRIIEARRLTGTASADAE